MTPEENSRRWEAAEERLLENTLNDHTPRRELTELEAMREVVEAARCAKALLSSGRFSDQEYIDRGCPTNDTVYFKLQKTLATLDAIAPPTTSTPRKP